MKTLSFEQMENVQGGAACSEKTTKAIAVIGLVASVGACIPGAGLLIFGPTALGMGIASTVCAYKK